jgi:hypothetical protein
MLPFEVLFSSETDAQVYYPLDLSLMTEDPLDQNIYYMTYYRNDLLSVATFLKLHSLVRATSAIDATVIDRVNHLLRFNLLYLLQSTTTNTRYVLTT